MTVKQAIQKARSNPANHMVSIATARTLADEVESLRPAAEHALMHLMGFTRPTESQKEVQRLLRKALYGEES